MCESSVLKVCVSKGRRANDNDIAIQDGQRSLTLWEDSFAPVWDRARTKA